MTLKRIKMALVFIILGFVTIVVFQNQAFIIEQTNGLNINLGLKRIVIEQTPIYVYFLCCFLAGFLCASYIMVIRYFRNKRLFKAYEEQISSLKNALSQTQAPTTEPSSEIPSSEDLINK